MGSYLPRLHRVYLVDDHDLVRRGLRDLLFNASDIDVVGDSGSALEATSEILRVEADVMLLDLHLQDGSGIEVCRAVRSVDPAVSGVLLTASGDDEALAATVLAGAAGYLVKLSRGTDIIGAVRRLGTGTSLLDAASVQRGSQLLRAVIDSLTPRVSEQERRVLDRVLEGQTDSQIAEELAESDGGADVAGPVARVARALLG